MKDHPPPCQDAQVGYESSLVAFPTCTDHNKGN